jgi:FemAB-related protein (PEP-CTERM system-associated)
VTIIECDASWRSRWDAYAARCPHASLYHLWAWSDVNAEELGHRTLALAAVDGDTIRGILPIVQVKSRLFGNIGCSMPFVNFGGPAADAPDIDEALLAEGARVAAREQMAYLEIRSVRPLPGPYPSQQHKISLTVDVPPAPDAMWAKFKSAHRQDIRKAEKAGFVARHGGAELLDDFYRVLSESWRDLGTPIYAKRYFARVLAALGSEGAWITVIYYAGEPAAAQMSGRFNGVAEGMWLGMREAFRRLYVGYVLYWEILKWASEHGHHKYHLGRSTADSGAEAFKKKWNAYAVQLYWHYALEPGRAMPQLNVNNPKYALAIQAWREMPIRWTQIIGPRVARCIP